MTSPVHKAHRTLCILWLELQIQIVISPQGLTLSAFTDGINVFKYFYFISGNFMIYIYYIIISLEIYFISYFPVLDKVSLMNKTLVTKQSIATQKLC